MADTIPSIALAFEKNNKNAMREKPYGLTRRVFTPFMISSIIATALIEMLITLGVFVMANKYISYGVAQTLALLSIVINEYIFTYNCKELKTFSFKKGLFDNKFMNISTAILLALQVVVFFTPVRNLFGLSVITPVWFLIVCGVNVLGFLIIEIIKPILSKLFKDK